MAEQRSRRTPLRVAAFVVFALAGVLFATSALTAQGSDLRGGDQLNLRDVVRAREDRVQALEAQVGALRTQIETLTDAHDSDELDELTAAEAELAVASGLTEVTGPSLTVTLNDSADLPADDVPPEGLTIDDYVVHQQDLEAVVNALWAGGAEAMMIMDQRVIATSAVRCVGSVLSLHGRTYSPPYRITAIGPVGDMRDALDASVAVSIYRQYAEQIGLGYDVTEGSSTTVPSYEGPLQLRWATVNATASEAETVTQ